MKEDKTVSDRNPRNIPTLTEAGVGAGGSLGSIFRFRSALEALSPFSTVLSSRVRQLLHRLADSLKDKPPTSDRCGDQDYPNSRSTYLELIGQLVGESGSLAQQPEGSLLHEYIINRLPAADHPCLHVCDRGWIPASEVRVLLESDLRCLQQLAQTPLAELVQSHHSPNSQICSEVDFPWRLATSAEKKESTKLPWDLSEDRIDLEIRFRKAVDWGTLVEPMIEFVRTHGAGLFQGTPAFTLSESGNHLRLEPITEFDGFSLDWWLGNDSKVATILENTEHLLRGLPAHNVLIWGPRGCGKSSMIRGLITRYFPRGLRGIQIPPHLHGRLSEVYPLVRDRPERFIGVLDNISLDARSPSFRQLASALDGGLERPPENLVFYATSNFKDLIDREGDRPAGPPRQQIDGFPGPGDGIATSSPRPEFFDPQQQQRLDERRGVDDRFALKVFLDLPRKSECDQLVLAYAERAGIVADADEVLATFNVWRMRHNHDLVGGRTARDFIQWLYAQEQSGTRPDHTPSTTLRNGESAPVSRFRNERWWIGEWDG